MYAFVHFDDERVKLTVRFGVSGQEHGEDGESGVDFFLELLSLKFGERGFELIG